MRSPNKLIITTKALRELGSTQLVNYALYQIGLKTGYFRWRTPAKSPGLRTKQLPRPTQKLQFKPFLDLPDPKRLINFHSDNMDSCLKEADEIVKGNVHLFGGPSVALELSLPGPLKHWTAYEKGEKVPGHQDIKWVWEPARFGWAIKLARAFYISGDEKYSQAFWQFTQKFLDSNPPNLGPQWASAQEVAFRLIALSFALHVFINSSHSNSERVGQLLGAISDHANRIPFTLRYAQAQNNNHLLAEAAGLYTAGYILPGHPKAGYWRSLGKYWLDQGYMSQIAEDGTYIQHSTNYHRLMLQIALWVNWVGSSIHSFEKFTDKQENQTPFSSQTRGQLRAATYWLLALLDEKSGRLPNLGPNDGADILPLTACSFYDYRPVIKAAALAFLEKQLFPEGLWDEMSIWCGLLYGNQSDENQKNRSETLLARDLQPSSRESFPVLRGTHSWAYLRVAKFDHRPGHADQLNLDLWWHGLNITQDAGTYLYNANKPWDNSLSGTDVHNTISVQGKDQMTRAGRFLWLNWAQGQIIDSERTTDGRLIRIMGQHDGYEALGVVHRREILVSKEDHWIINDQLIPSSKISARKIPDHRRNSFDIRLHWLLPDWRWELEKSRDTSECQLRIKSPHGWITLQTTAQEEFSSTENLESPVIRIFRAGELLQGPGPSFPIYGWFSPTYGVKVPSISFSIDIKTTLPLKISTKWAFP